MFVKAALKTTSPQIDDVEDLESPSTAVKLGYDIKRLTNAKLGIAIKEDNDEERKKCLDFLKLIEMEWSLKVTRLASTTLQARRLNKDRQLPDSDDLVQITKTVKLDSKKLEEKMRKPDAACFRRGVMLAQTRLLLYNKRKAGEIEGEGEEITIEGAVAVYCDPSTFLSVKTFNKFSDGLVVAVGVHPKKVSQASDAQVHTLQALLKEWSL